MVKWSYSTENDDTRVIIECPEWYDAEDVAADAAADEVTHSGICEPSDWPMTFYLYREGSDEAITAIVELEWEPSFSASIPKEK